jgi:hypothetical protein
MNLSSLPSRVQALRDGFARCAIDVRSLAGIALHPVRDCLHADWFDHADQPQCTPGRLLTSCSASRGPPVDVRPYTIMGGRLLTLYQSDPCRFLEKAVSEMAARPTGGRVQDLLHHAREACMAVWDYLARHSNIRVLHIKRRNILAQYLSLQLAHKTNVWSTIHPVARETQPVRLEIEDCRKHFAWVRSLEEEADAFFAGHEMLQVVYEDLLADQTAELSKVQEFLGLREQRLSARTVRQRTVPLPRAIANYGALKKAFSGTDWEDFFAETAD